MRLDLLISKYLDGELTHEEDVQLRALVSSNSRARDEFDAAVLLNAAFKEDAEAIKAPADIVCRTEDIVLMKILNAGSVVANTRIIPTKRRFGFLPAYSLIIAVFALATIFNLNYISESEFSFAESFENMMINETSANASARNIISYNNPNSSDLRAVVKPTNQPKVIETDFETIEIYAADNLAIYPSDNIILSNEDIAEQVLIESVFADMMDSFENKEIAVVNNNTDFRQKYASQRTIGETPNFNMKNNSMPYALDFSFIDPFGANTDVHVSTYYSRDYANPSKADNKPIISYSQSITYSISEKSRIGLEVGATEYTYGFNTFVRVSTGPIGLSSSTEGLNPIDAGTGIAIPLSLQKQSNAYWVSTVWDYDIFKGDVLSVESRLGGGFSVEGSMLYGRLLGNLHVYSGIHLNFGCEVRGFNAKITNTKNGILKTGSLLYGVQVKF